MPEKNEIKKKKRSSRIFKARIWGIQRERKREFCFFWCSQKVAMKLILQNFFLYFVGSAGCGNEWGVWKAQQDLSCKSVGSALSSESQAWEKHRVVHQRYSWQIDRSCCKYSLSQCEVQNERQTFKPIKSKALNENLIQTLYIKRSSVYELSEWFCRNGI